MSCIDLRLQTTSDAFKIFRLDHQINGFIFFRIVLLEFSRDYRMPELFYLIIVPFEDRQPGIRRKEKMISPYKIIDEAVPVLRRLIIPDEVSELLYRRNQIFG